MIAYVVLAVILSIPILVATAIGGSIGRFVESRSVGCWTSAVLGALFYAGPYLGLLYYNAHLAGGVPEPAPPLGEIVGDILLGGGIFSVGSFFVCRIMRWKHECK
jgi:hypothetical protein